MTTAKLQRVLNAADRVVSGTNKYDRGMLQLLHTELHWLDLSERVVYKLSIMAYNCPHGQVPLYLAQLCQSVTGVASRQHLRSTTRQHLVVPRYRLSIYAHRAFSVAGPSISNSLPDSLLDPVVGGNSFRQLLVTFMSVVKSEYWNL